MIYEREVVIPRDRKLKIDWELPEAVPDGTANLMLVAGPPMTMLLSETALAKDWSSIEEDSAWETL
jgi:hypothetical protein